MKVIKLVKDKIIVGYTAEGEPFTEESYNKRLEEVERQILVGE
ncbi:hypothetical protein [Lunatibacter salilacus]|nr:hypothetical protein [Lunatibacter salilacus]